MVWWTSPAGPAVMNNRVDQPVLWEKVEGKEKAQPLFTIGNDPDGVAFGINNQGQAVGFSGTCIAVNFAVLWENGTATPLPDLGTPGAIAYAINGHNQIVGQAVNSEGTALAAIWENNTVEVLASFCQEMLPLLPPASTTGARVVEAPSTPS